MNVRVKTVEAVMNTPELEFEINKQGKIFNVILYDGWGMYPLNKYSGGEDEKEFLLGNIYEVLYVDMRSTNLLPIDIGCQCISRNIVEEYL